MERNESIGVVERVMVEGMGLEEGDEVVVVVVGLDDFDDLCFFECE